MLSECVVSGCYHGMLLWYVVMVCCYGMLLWYVVRLCSDENPFMSMRNICVTHAVCKRVTFSTFNVLNVFAVVQ